MSEENDFYVKCKGLLSNKYTANCSLHLCNYTKLPCSKRHVSRLYAVGSLGCTMPKWGDLSLEDRLEQLSLELEFDLRSLERYNHDVEYYKKREEEKEKLRKKNYD